MSCSNEYGIAFFTLELNIPIADIVHGKVLKTGYPKPSTIIYFNAGYSGGHTIPLCLDTSGTLSIYYPNTSLFSSPGRIDVALAYVYYHPND